MKYFWLILVSIYCNNASATTVDGTVVKSLLLGKVYGEKAFIEVGTKPTLTSGHCQTNGTYNYVLDISTELGRSILGLVLTAYAAKSNIYINGYDTCETFGGVEDLRQFELK
jgi:hypothetical protein